jgi:hypothetical protein
VYLVCAREELARAYFDAQPASEEPATEAHDANA